MSTLILSSEIIKNFWCVYGITWKIQTTILLKIASSINSNLTKETVILFVHIKNGMYLSFVLLFFSFKNLCLKDSTKLF